MSTPSAPDAAWLRFGAITAIGGGLLAILFNAAHAGPRRGDTRLFLEDLAASRIWEADHLGIAVALLLLAAALVVLGRTLTAGPAGPWAAAATGIALIGTALALVNVAIDGPAMHEVADRWVTASGVRLEALFAAAEVLRSVDIALFSAWTLVLVGATPILFGIAMARSGEFPVWLGPLGIVGGAVGVVTASIQWFTGLRPVTVFVLFPMASGALAIWILAVGIVLWQRASRGVAPDHPLPA